MFQGTLLLLYIFLFAVVQAKPKDFVDDELYKHVMAQLDIQEEEARNLLEIEADGSIGSKCGIFNECNTGFECFQSRCIPSRECMKAKLEEFNSSFDHEEYKKTMFEQSGVTEEDVILAYQESNGEELKFVESTPMKSLIAYMQEHWEPFEPVKEIVESCAGIVSARRLKVNPIEKTTLRLGDNGGEERRLQGGNTWYLGLHIEGGLVFELSLTVAWKMGATNTNMYLRGCFGAEVIGGIEFSFYAAITFDSVETGYACGSILFDTDAGLALNIGLEFGICFISTNTIYVGITIGAGVGAGAGFNICGVLTRAPGGATNSTDSGTRLLTADMATP